MRGSTRLLALSRSPFSVAAVIASAGDLGHVLTRLIVPMNSAAHPALLV